MVLVAQFSIHFPQSYPQILLEIEFSAQYVQIPPPPSAPIYQFLFFLVIDFLETCIFLFSSPLVVSGLGLNCQPGFFTSLLSQGFTFSFSFFSGSHSFSFLIYFLVWWNTSLSSFQERVQQPASKMALSDPHFHVFTTVCSPLPTVFERSDVISLLRLGYKRLQLLSWETGLCVSDYLLCGK